MNYGKQGLKVLGISLLAALGLMAFGAGGASASGSFLIVGIEAPWEEEIEGESENFKEVGSKFWILGLNIEIFCHKMRYTGKISSAGYGHAELKFSECLVSGTNSDGTLKGPVCELKNSIIAKIKILVVLHDSKPYLLMSSLDGLTFAEVNGEPCLPSAKVKGSTVVSISNPDGDDIIKLISTKGLASLFSDDKLIWGQNAMHLTVDAILFLFFARAWGAD